MLEMDTGIFPQINEGKYESKQRSEFPLFYPCKQIWKTVIIIGSKYIPLNVLLKHVKSFTKQSNRGGRVKVGGH